MNAWINSPILTTVVGAAVGAFLTYCFGRLEKSKEVKKEPKQNQKKNNINNCENCRNLEEKYRNSELEKKILNDKHQGFIKAISKISENNPKIKGSIDKENLSKLATVQNEVVAEIEPYGFAVSKFVEKNFITLISSPSNFKKLQEKGWDIRLNKEILKKMIWELETFRNFRDN